MSIRTDRASETLAHLPGLGRNAMVGLVALGVAIRLALVVMLPFGREVGFARLEGLNDEPSHFNYVAFLADSLRLPVQRHSIQDPGAFERNDYEYFQSPLYYAAGAVLRRIVGPHATLLVCRLLSCTFGLLSLAALWRVGGVLGVGTPVRRTMVALAALMPTHSYFCSVVSNDSLSWLLVLLALRAALLVARPDSQDTHRGWRTAGWLAVVLSAALLTKSSTVVVFPVVGAAYLLAWHDRREPRMLLLGSAVAAIPLLVAAPWYVRNTVLYGSPTALAFASGPPRHNLWEVPVFVGFVKYTVRTVWFPMQHIPGSRAAGLLGYAGAALIALNVVLAARALPHWSGIRRQGLLLGLLVAGNLAAFAAFNLHWPNAEGRYLLPSLAPLSLVGAAAVAHLCRGRRLRRIAGWLVAVEMLWPYCYLLLAAPYVLF